jgi:hypothetical protein
MRHQSHASLKSLTAALALTAAVMLGACSSERKAGDAADPAPAADDNRAVATATPPKPEAPAAASPPPAPAANQLALEGLGDLRLGEAVPIGGRWAARGAQTSDACEVVSSPDYPGVYAIVTAGKVRRITVGQRSQLRLVEGIGIGTPERDVTRDFPGFVVEPHKYEDAPAKYLTSPAANKGGPALRFEIGGNGKVSLIHVGLMPELALVEGCG